MNPDAAARAEIVEALAEILLTAVECEEHGDEQLDSVHVTALEEVAAK